MVSLNPAARPTGNPAVAAHIIARIGEARARLGIATAATASPLRASADMRLSIKVVPLSAMATAPVRPNAASTIAAGPDRRAGTGGTVLANKTADKGWDW